MGVLPAQELWYLPLSSPGQASIAIDGPKQTAYIVDLGNGVGAKSIEVEDVPLLEWLVRREIRHVVFACSHPHLDHAGGILALVRDPRPFFADSEMTQPRFESVAFVDDVVASSKDRLPNLHDLWKSNLGQNAKIKTTYTSAHGSNAFASMSRTGDQVEIENIPYEPDDQAGPHGRALVTRMVLGGRHTHVDFDDADSAATSRAIKVLIDRKTAHIDSFVVPHHGSASNDIELILALKPATAIIAVNPANAYRHPAPRILKTLIDRLGAANVLFTGSVDAIALRPTGVARVRFTAAQPESYDLYVRPNLERAIEKKDLSVADADAYAYLRQVMCAGKCQQIDASEPQLLDKVERAGALAISPNQHDWAVQMIADSPGYRFLGPPAVVLERYFGFQEREAKELVRPGEVTADTLRRGLNSLSSRKQLSSMARLVEALSRAPVDPSTIPRALDSYRRRPPTVSPERLPPGMVSSASPRDLSADTKAINRRYRDFITERYGDKKSRSFVRMSEEADGFGGIVFGSRITPDATLRVIGTSWVPIDEPQMGQLRMTLADGSVRSYLVNAEDLIAASRIVVGIQENSSGADEGIGLVHLDSQGYGFNFSETGIRYGWALAHPVTIHPGLAGTALARSLVVADGLLRQRQLLKPLLDTFGETQPPKEPALFEALKGAPSYRFLDVPITIADDGVRIVPTRTAPGGMLAKVFLQFRAFKDDGTQLDQAAAQFEAVAPDLVTASEDYDRLNQFAATLAVVRWLHRQGVPLPQPESQPQLPTPGWIMFSPSTISLLPITSGEAGTLSSIRVTIEATLHATHNPSVAGAFGQRGTPRFIEDEEQHLARTGRLAERLDDAYGVVVDCVKTLRRIAAALTASGQSLPSGRALRAAVDSFESSDHARAGGSMTRASIRELDSALMELTQTPASLPAADVNREITACRERIAKAIAAVDRERASFAPAYLLRSEADALDKLKELLFPGEQETLRRLDSALFLSSRYRSPLLDWLTANPDRMDTLRKAEIPLKPGDIPPPPSFDDRNWVDVNVELLRQSEGASRILGERSFISQILLRLPEWSGEIEQFQINNDLAQRKHDLFEAERSALLRRPFPQFDRWWNVRTSYVDSLKELFEAVDLATTR